MLHMPLLHLWSRHDSMQVNTYLFLPVAQDDQGACLSITQMKWPNRSPYESNWIEKNHQQDTGQRMVLQGWNSGTEAPGFDWDSLWEKRSCPPHMLENLIKSLRVASIPSAVSNWMILCEVLQSKQTASNRIRWQMELFKAWRKDKWSDKEKSNWCHWWITDPGFPTRSVYETVWPNHEERWLNSSHDPLSQVFEWSKLLIHTTGQKRTYHINLHK